MAILIISLVFLFFSFSLGQVARVQVTPGIAITGLDIATTLFVIVWSCLLCFKKTLPFTQVWKSFTLFILLAGFSLLFNVWYLPQSQALAAFLYLIRFIIYGCLFFIVYSFTQKQKNVLKIFMLVSGMVMVAIGYIQFFYYPALRNLYYQGWDEHFYRMFGTFFDPNFFGLFLVGYNLFLLYLFYQTKKSSLKLLYSCVSFFSIVALFLTYSRTALFSLFFGILIFLFLNNHKKAFLILLITLVIGGASLFFITSGRSEGTNMLRVVSAEARFGNMIDALTVWKDNYIFGVGFDAYRYAQHRHGIYKAGWEEGHGSAGADNSFLFVLATTGIVGLCAYVYFLSQHIVQLNKEKGKLDKTLGIAMLISLSIGSFFINGLFYPSLLVWLWMILGITENT